MTDTPHDRLATSPPVTVVTKDIGGTASTTGILYGEPDRRVPDAGSNTDLAATGVNAAFVADFLSSCLAHERCGVHLYRSVARRSMLPELRDRYEEFGRETLDHVALLEELVLGSGGNPNYVSAAARASEKAASGLLESTWALGGSIDDITEELSMLEAVMVAEAKCLGNWQLLAKIAEDMSDGEVKRQFTTVTTEVLAQEGEHYGWATEARARMIYGLATATALATGEDVDA
jgi:ferritin-like metal-binding protein YciE